MWAYFQHLEGTVKRLTSQVDAETRSKAQLVEKLNAHDQHIAALTAEVAALRQQLAAPQEESSPTDSAAAHP
jgi:cell division protein FtsB